VAKAKTVFFCQSCGAQSSKWLGRCPSCNEWNTFVEEVVHSEKDQKDWEAAGGGRKTPVPRQIESISSTAEKRLKIPDEELNRVLGGGLVPGSMVLVGGEPGIGKSTLMLQLAISLAGHRILYISGEESEQQIKMRAERLGKTQSDCYILTETSLQNIFKQIEMLRPAVIIVDSVQTLYTAKIESSPGSVSQIRECTSELLQFAKAASIPVFLIGHITKDGAIAGPKVLEHMVDTVLQFEGDRHHIYRILRATKNRFGSTSEIGIYEMGGTGLREVSNPSEILISHKTDSLSGIAITATIEGLRPLLIETQALVSSAVYGTPQRSSTGFDLRRLNMLLAVLEKRCGFRLALKDVFLNIAGGIKVEDPGIDLGVICAILSSSEDIPISGKTCFAAEVGLSGEIRAVNRVEQRISEAEKLGFQKIFVSRYNFSGKDDSLLKNHSIEILPLVKVEEAFSLLFG
jgi:DNA repair protein RadA/Sms